MYLLRLIMYKMSIAWASGISGSLCNNLYPSQNMVKFPAFVNRGVTALQAWEQGQNPFTVQGSLP